MYFEKFNEYEACTHTITGVFENPLDLANYTNCCSCTSNSLPCFDEMTSNYPLQPHYVDLIAARAFHLSLKKVCDKYNPEFYSKFKVWADTYFFLPHRNESRGVGGIFFDNQNENSRLSKKQLLNFCLDLGREFPVIYREQIEFKAYDTPTLEELKWQALRRGRYVEFNLLHDRGTKFGIYSSGRTESILMSMPPMANWEYNFTPEENSEEDKTLKFLNGKIKSFL